MKRLKVVIKDQFDQESIALAKVRPANDQKLELYKSVEHIEIDDDIILPNLCTRQISQNPYPIRVLPS
ncbi:hypothetical protein CAT61_05135 [Acinetobacter baumannii]|nr:hypothetical protein CAT61_05135 [Acinetobacter baumannii]